MDFARQPRVVNGAEVEVDDRHAKTPLLWVLRNVLELRGTKFGCGVGVCGACTVLDEKGGAVRSCQVTATAANGRSWTTIEGLARVSGSSGGDKDLHPCQRAWIEEDVAQCGFCQPGMILTACALLRDRPAPSDAEIDAAMSESVCRCGTYGRMRRAIKRAGATMREAKGTT